MKKAISLLLVMLFLIPALAFSYDKGEKGEYRMGKGMMRSKASKMGMMGMMMKKQMVSTPEGGVIVISGNKLLKYDKDLNLVKEVEIKMDIDSMKNMMDKIKEECPRYKQGTEDKEESSKE